MRYRAMAMTAAAVTAGLTVAACSAASPHSAASTKQARPVHTAPLSEASPGGGARRRR